MHAHTHSPSLYNSRMIAFSYLFEQCCIHIFTGISPRIVEHPQNQCAELGGTVTFRCEASTSAHEFQITYKWLLSHDGRDSEVIQKGKPASAELTITKVTEEQRGKYKCIVKNEFGEEKSQSAKLMIGM